MKDYLESLASTVCLSVGFENAAAKFDAVSLNKTVVSRRTPGRAFPSIWPSLVEPTR